MSILRAWGGGDEIPSPGAGAESWISHLALQVFGLLWGKKPTEWEERLRPASPSQHMDNCPNTTRYFFSVLKQLKVSNLPRNKNSHHGAEGIAW